MRKKNNTEQETEEQPATENQETETPVEDHEETQEETPTQEQETEDQEESEEEESDAEDETEDPQEQQEEPAQQPSADENAELRQQLLQARGQIAAYSAGVVPGMIEDAVTLAMAEAARSGEVTEASVTKAMEAVLKRHPEWKASNTDKSKGGFKLGADRDNGGNGRPSGKQNQNVKRWNRFK